MLNFFLKDLNVLHEQNVDAYFLNHFSFFENIRNMNILVLDSIDNLNERFSSKNLRRIDTCAIMQTTGDGNCLWNCVSNSLFGNENYSILFRLFTFYTMFKHSVYFQRTCLTETRELKFYMQESLSLGVWGRDIHVLALSILLNRTFCAVFYSDIIKSNAQIVLSRYTVRKVIQISAI